MRLITALFAATTLLGTQGCATLEFLGGQCPQEQLTVTWPITITRGSSTASPLLTYTLTASNVDQSQFNALRSALADGGTTPYNVTWTISAFDTNGGYISFTHPMPLARGQTLQVANVFTGAGWGAQQTGAATAPAIGVRADGFVATSASGTITVLDTAPLRLRIDVTTSSTSGVTLRVAGDVGFNYAKVTTICT
jgi:hypothetical protein